MILLTRLNGEQIVINADLIERAEATPDTVLTLTSGTKYVVAETLDEVTAATQLSRAKILALAGTLTPPTDSNPTSRLRVVAAASIDDAAPTGRPTPDPPSTADQDPPSTADQDPPPPPASVQPARRRLFTSGRGADLVPGRHLRRIGEPAPVSGPLEPTPTAQSRRSPALSPDPSVHDQAGRVPL
ncbi:MAG: flagellar FlbD family protein [Actinomycetota bacterium]|nr:flagellar FlbD family protein [Actinomycetota bacterium]